MLPLALSRKTLFAPIALLLIIAAMTGFLVFNHFTAARQTEAWVIQSHEVIEAAQRVFADVQDVESGARGFMIRGNATILEDYRKGLARFPEDARRLDEFYAVAAVFGFAYGGVMPLYAVLAREYFGQRILGAVFGAAAMVSSLGMALGPALGGWVFDAFGRYTWMYIGSAAIGLGAVAIALAFPPFPNAARELSPAAA